MRVLRLVGKRGGIAMGKGVVSVRGFPLGRGEDGRGHWGDVERWSGVAGETRGGIRGFERGLGLQNDMRSSRCMLTGLGAAEGPLIGQESGKGSAQGRLPGGGAEKWYSLE